VTQVDPRYDLCKRHWWCGQHPRHECEWQNPHSDDFSRPGYDPVNVAARVVHCRLPEMLRLSAKVRFCRSKPPQDVSFSPAYMRQPVAGRW